jgi:hypothetical protein
VLWKSPGFRVIMLGPLIPKNTDGQPRENHLRGKFPQRVSSIAACVMEVSGRRKGGSKHDFAKKKLRKSFPPGQDDARQV